MANQIERKLAYGVKVKITDIDTIQNLIWGNTPSEKSKKLGEIAGKNHCIGLDVIKNSFVYLFLLYNEAEMFYNQSNKVVKCTLLKRQIKVVAERNMPIAKA